MSDVRPTDPQSVLFRLAGWLLLMLGAALGVVTPSPVTTAVWTLAARAFARGGDTAMPPRLMSATKFGPRIRRNLNRPAPGRIGAVYEA